MRARTRGSFRFGEYVSDFFNSLNDDSLDEFPWMSGLEGGHFIQELAGEGSIFDILEGLKQAEKDWNFKVSERLRLQQVLRLNLKTESSAPYERPKKQGKPSGRKFKCVHIDSYIIVFLDAHMAQKILF